jgi:hypothetical protein
MIKTIVDCFQIAFDFIYTLFSVVWTLIVGIADFISTLVGGLYTALNEGQSFMQEVLPNALKWMWDNWFNPLIDLLMSSVEDFDALGQITQAFGAESFPSIMINNYVTHFVNVDLVIATFSAACLFMLSLATFKFCVKLIPTIG